MLSDGKYTSLAAEVGSAAGLTRPELLCPAGSPAALDAAIEEAHKGIEFTKTIRATKGRASYLGDRSIGHQDPGATSATLTLETVRDFLKA